MDTVDYDAERNEFRLATATVSYRGGQCQPFIDILGASLIFICMRVTRKNRS